MLAPGACAAIGSGPDQGCGGLLSGRDLEGRAVPPANGSRTTRPAQALKTTRSPRPPRGDRAPCRPPCARRCNGKAHLLGEQVAPRERDHRRDPGPWPAGPRQRNRGTLLVVRRRLAKGPRNASSRCRFRPLHLQTFGFRLAPFTSCLAVELRPTCDPCSTRLHHVPWRAHDASGNSLTSLTWTTPPRSSRTCAQVRRGPTAHYRWRWGPGMGSLSRTHERR